MKNIKFLSKKNASKKGFALTEVLLAIAVIVIIGIAAYPLYKNARVTSQVEATANDMAIVQTNAQTLYSGQSSYTGLGGKVLDTAGLMPSDLGGGLSTPAGTYTNSWGGGFNIVPSGAVGNALANTMLTIVLTNVPQSACTQLVNRVAPAFTYIGIATALPADGAAGPTDDTIKGSNAASPSQVDITNLGTACPSAGGSLAFSSN